VSEHPDKPANVSRRRFVAVVAAGSAALLARPAAAVAAAARSTHARTAAPAAPGMTPAQRKEYDRQRTGTLDTLKAIRSHVMPPGTEMASVFHARRPVKKGN
jgi:hypothetical protein